MILDYKNILNISLGELGIKKCRPSTVANHCALIGEKPQTNHHFLNPPQVMIFKPSIVRSISAIFVATYNDGGYRNAKFYTQKRFSKNHWE